MADGLPTVTYTTEQLADVSFQEALDRLDAVRSAFTDRFLDGGVSVWAGSMISHMRYPDLGALITRLLDTLHELSADITDLKDPERRTLDQILGLSGDPGGDATVRFSDWSSDLKKKVIKVLRNQYSAVLGTRYVPKGKETGSILWDVLHIDEIYDDPAVDPDAEHRLLALLVLEGVLTRLVTTNWDPLIEDAHQQAAGHLDGPRLNVIVHPADIEGTGGQPSLVKMHGCARRAKNDEDARGLVVGTRHQVKEWPPKEAEPIRDELNSISRAFQVLYLGLSGQDLNIQQQHIRANLFSDWNYSERGPRVTFANGDLNEQRDEILEAVYGTDTYQHTDNYEAIRGHCLVPLFAKPLLGALFAYVIREKLRAFASALPNADLQQLAVRGVEAFFRHAANLVDAVSESATSPREVRRWRFVSEQGAQFVSSFIRVFRKGEAVRGPWEYHALSRDRKPDPQPSDYYLALIIGILVEGHDQGRWRLSLIPDRPEQLILHTPLRIEVPVFVACDKLISAKPLTSIIPEPDKQHIIIVAQGRDDGNRGSSTPTTPRLTRLDPPPRVEIFLDALIEQTDPVVALHDALIEEALARPLIIVP